MSTQCQPGPPASSSHAPEPLQINGTPTERTPTHVPNATSPLREEDDDDGDATKSHNVEDELYVVVQASGR